MSLFLSEWKHGYEIFLDFAEMSWSPHISCAFDDYDDTKIHASATILDVNLVDGLANALPESIQKDFIGRFNGTTTFILDRINIHEFIHLNFNYAMKVTGDVDRANEAVNLAFSQMLMEYEFWHKEDIVHLYANLIFYGMIDNPMPMFFAIPPQSEWDTKYYTGWAGYPNAFRD